MSKPKSLAPRKFSKDEFIEWESAKCNITIELHKKIFKEVIPCDCGVWICRGWESVPRKHPLKSKPKKP